jgi:hypothetical protein
MSTNKQPPHETFRGQLIGACVAAGIDMAIAHALHEDAAGPAVVVGFNATKLDRYVEMLEGLVDGEDLVRVQLLIAERYKTRSTQK